jgi:hypothetical protein
MIMVQIRLNFRSFLVCFSLAALSVFQLYAEEDLYSDPVTKEPLLSVPVAEAIDEVENKMNAFHDVVSKGMPNHIRLEVLGCDTVDKIDLLPAESQLWLHKNVQSLGDLDVGEALERISKELTFHMGDCSTLALESFWSRLKNIPYNYHLFFVQAAIRWRENERPTITNSPQGMGRIDWIWTLEEKSRPHGVMHVGIEVERRNFVCYERSLGIYFPEGDKLERIYREIVQNPEMAGGHLGIGRQRNK